MASETLDVVVVGAGLFGSVISAALRAAGMSVATIADQRAGMGSVPAACLMKPSWLNSVHPLYRDQSLELLSSLYGVQDLVFQVRTKTWLPKGQATVHWVDPADILQPPDIVGTVGSVEPDGSGWLVHHKVGEEPVETVSARHVVLATGIWGQQLAPGLCPEVKPRWGAAYLWRTGWAPAFIRPWAPYKQIVAFDRGDGLWIGDGTSLKELTRHRALESRQRCAEEVGAAPEDLVELAGARPYVRLENAEPCLLASSGGLHVATGGAKNGTLAAGWAAHRLTELLS